MWNNERTLAVAFILAAIIVLVVFGIYNRPFHHAPKCTAAISATSYPNGTTTTIWYPKGCKHG